MYIYISIIMKRMCPRGYHHNGFVLNHALWHIIQTSMEPLPLNNSNNSNIIE